MYSPNKWKTQFLQQAGAAATYGLAAYLNRSRHGKPNEYTGQDPRQEKMARFRRRTRGRTITKSRRRFRRRGGRIMRRVRGISKLLRRKGLSNIEIKYLRSGTTLTPGFWGPNNVTTNMLVMSQSAGMDNYIGGKIFVRNIRLQYILRANGAQTGEGYVRVLIVRDKAPNDNANNPISEMLFDNYIGSTAVITQSQADQGFFMWGWTNNRYKGRFQILYHAVHKLSGDVDAGHNVVMRSKTIPVFKPWYQNADAAGTDRGPGGIYMLTWSTFLTNPPTLNEIHRVGYTDC